MGACFGLYRNQPPGGKCQPIKMTFHKLGNCLIYCHTKTRLTSGKLNLLQHPQFPPGGASTPDQCNCVQVTDAPAHLVLRVISSDASLSSGSASVGAASQWWERVSAVTHAQSLGHPGSRGRCWPPAFNKNFAKYSQSFVLVT